MPFDNTFIDHVIRPAQIKVPNHITQASGGLNSNNINDPIFPSHGVKRNRVHNVSHNNLQINDLTISLGQGDIVTCCFNTFSHFKTATAVLIPLQSLEMLWLFRNGQLFLLVILIPHQFDISG